MIRNAWYKTCVNTYDVLYYVSYILLIFHYITCNIWRLRYFSNFANDNIINIYETNNNDKFCTCNTCC